MEFPGTQTPAQYLANVLDNPKALHNGKAGSPFPDEAGQLELHALHDQDRWALVALTESYEAYDVVVVHQEVSLYLAPALNRERRAENSRHFDFKNAFSMLRAKNDVA